MINVSIVLFQTEVSEVNRLINLLLPNTLVNKILIIDNSPTPISDIQAAPKLTIINRPDNPGYGKGHNLAMRYSLESEDVKYHLVINADIDLEICVIDELYDFMERNISIAQAMPKVLNPDGTNQNLCKLIPTPFDLLFKRFFPFFGKSPRFILDVYDLNEVVFAPYLSGCFMFLRVEHLRKVGLFDERFFMYPEDIDLTRRLAERYRTVLYPFVSVVHQHGAASHRSLRMFAIHFLNLVKYYNKWGWFRDKSRRTINYKVMKELEEMQ